MLGGWRLWRNAIVRDDSNAKHRTRSYTVAASSLLFLTVCVPYARASDYVAAGAFALVTVCSALADGLCPHWAWTHPLDRVVATVVFFAYPVRVIAFDSCASPTLRATIVVLAGVSLACLRWARASTTQAQFVLRQSVWHVVAASSLAYTAVP